GYDDSGWSNGLALFGLEEPGIYPEPIRTPLSLTGSNGFIRTFYFRTALPLDEPSAFSGLFVNGYIDDGAVFYLNGREAGRVRIPAELPVDGVAYNDFGTGVTQEGAASTVVLPLTNVVAGANTLAVEVHQNTGTSSDVVFGMSLDSITPVTNAPVLLPLELLPGNMLRITLFGIPGRDYSIDTSPDLENWTSIITFTDFNEPFRAIEVPRQSVGQRFYRARAVPWMP